MSLYAGVSASLTMSAGAHDATVTVRTKHPADGWDEWSNCAWVRVPVGGPPASTAEALDLLIEVLLDQRRKLVG